MGVGHMLYIAITKWCRSERGKKDRYIGDNGEMEKFFILTWSLLIILSKQARKDRQDISTLETCRKYGQIQQKWRTIYC